MNGTGVVELWWSTIIAGDGEKKHGLFVLFLGKYTNPLQFTRNSSGSYSITSKTDKVTKQMLSESDRLPLTLIYPIFPHKEEIAPPFFLGDWYSLYYTM